MNLFKRKGLASFLWGGYEFCLFFMVSGTNGSFEVIIEGNIRPKAQKSRNLFFSQRRRVGEGEEKQRNQNGWVGRAGAGVERWKGKIETRFIKSMVASDKVKTRGIIFAAVTMLLLYICSPWQYILGKMDIEWCIFKIFLVKIKKYAFATCVYSCWPSSFLNLATIIHSSNF